MPSEIPLNSAAPIGHKVPAPEGHEDKKMADHNRARASLQPTVINRRKPITRLGRGIGAQFSLLAVRQNPSPTQVPPKSHQGFRGFLLFLKKPHLGTFPTSCFISRLNR